mmetsp:Transcript_12513/g.31213  ORF Transcript_12513/g.31213 Transcript_12513/m.31213 type:complete len:241 (+) Transcript_12513:871-1593(+)
MQDELQLVQLVTALIHWPPPQQLCEYTPCRPDVHRLRVPSGEEKDLRCAVPTSDHVLCHDASTATIFVDRARQAEVGDLQVAIGVEQQVGRLQVSMDHVGRVHVLQPTQDLIDKPLAMVFRERLWRADDAMHVRVHDVAHEVEVPGRRGPGVRDTADVLVLQVTQQQQLAERALPLDDVRVLAHRAEHLLDGDLLGLSLCTRSAHHAERPLPKHAVGRKLLRYSEGNALAAHRVEPVILA